MQKKHLISIDVSLGDYHDFVNNIMMLAENEQRSEYVCVANAHMLVEAYKEKDFADVVNDSKITTPDGMSLIGGLRLLYKIKQSRVSGMDLLPDLLSEASKHKKPVFFYGSTEDILMKTKKHISINYPGIPHVGTYSPPFCLMTEDDDDENVVKIINSSPARLVFVALGCPKQEKWMASMKGRINAVMIGIGGALPVLIGMQKRAPKWMQKVGMEWFFRFLQEPLRLWKRYVTTNSMFIILIVREKFFGVNKHF